MDLIQRKERKTETSRICLDISSAEGHFGVDECSFHIWLKLKIILVKFFLRLNLQRVSITEKKNV